MPTNANSIDTQAVLLGNILKIKQKLFKFLQDVNSHQEVIRSRIRHGVCLIKMISLICRVRQSSHLDESITQWNRLCAMPTDRERAPLCNSIYITSLHSLSS